MKVALEIISREDIKPSIPTLPHLRTYELSLLDHLIPAPNAPIILFYPSHHSACPTVVPKTLDLLKQSLSETLTHFYPLSGKIKDDLSIECNDEGANFITAEVKCSLPEFLSQPDLILLQKFLPNDLTLKESSSGTYVTNIQVNIFACGGICIGVCISHRILDGAALSTFLKNWTGIARGCKEMANPKFMAASLFPLDGFWLRDLSMAMFGSLFKKGKCVTRRFLFSNSAIATVKDQMPNSSQITRLQVVSAILWRSLMAASKAKFGIQRQSLVTHLVNLRKRINKALYPEHAIGNLLWLAAADCKADHEIGLGELVGMLRTAISKIDDDFVEEMQSDGGKSKMYKSLKAIGEVGSKDEVDYFGFSSWCNLGFYEADFGWGKPIWVSSVGSNGSVFLNLIILVDTRLGDGIEAWITLDEQEMAYLETNTELLSYATLDPSPLATAIH